MPAEKADHDWFEFYRKFVDVAVYDLSPDKQGVDLQVANKLVTGSPKEAQITIQVLWGEYKELKSKGDSRQLDLRLHCCSLALAYIGAFGLEDEGTLMILRMCPGLDEELVVFAEEQGLS